MCAWGQLYLCVFACQIIRLSLLHAPHVGLPKWIKMVQNETIRLCVTLNGLKRDLVGRWLFLQRTAWEMQLPPCNNNICRF